MDMKKPILISLVAFAVIALMFLSCKTKKVEIPVALEQVTSEISQVIHSMDTNIKTISKRLSGVPIVSEEARNILRSEYGKINSVIELSTITPEGILSIIVPDTCKSSEGADVNNQDHIIKVKQTKKPVLSSAFHAVEGFQAVVLAYPVLSDNNELKGITSMLIRPESFLKNIITPDIEGIPVDIWVMQKDGMILFDYDVDEIGRNLFTDTLYKPYTESLKTAARIAEEKQGNATYNFLGHGLEKPVTNDAFWTTLETYGMEWKVVMIRPVGTHEVKRTIKSLGLKSATEDIAALSRNEDFLKLISESAKDEVLVYFERFYAAHEVYSIEYVDSTVTCRFGYPPQCSLEDYKITEEDQSQRDFYNTVMNRTEASFKQGLLEGNSGVFYCFPLNYQGRYLGMVYYIVIEP
jgi:hypothetical protein